MLHFISSLEFTLRHGLAQEKLVALRQGIERVRINKPENRIRLMIREIPTGRITSICDTPKPNSRNQMVVTFMAAYFGTG